MKSLFLTTDRAGDNIEMVGKGLDAIVHTQEEKAQFMLLWLKGTGPTNVSRRVIAFVVTGIWALFQLVWLLLWFMDFFIETTALAGSIREHISATISNPFMIVMGFYFAPHLLAALRPGDLKAVVGSNH